MSGQELNLEGTAPVSIVDIENQAKSAIAIHTSGDFIDNVGHNLQLKIRDGTRLRGEGVTAYMVGYFLGKTYDHNCGDLVKGSNKANLTIPEGNPQIMKLVIDNVGYLPNKIGTALDIQQGDLLRFQPLSSHDEIVFTEADGIRGFFEGLYDSLERRADRRFEWKESEQSISSVDLDAMSR